MLSAQEIAKVKKLLNGTDANISVIFSALSDRNRCLIFRSFLKRNRLCVSDVANIVGISMPLASQHLKILETNGLLVREREGRQIYYTPKEDNPIVAAIIKAVQ